MMKRKLVKSLVKNVLGYVIKEGDVFTLEVAATENPIQFTPIANVTTEGNIRRITYILQRLPIPAPALTVKAVTKAKVTRKR